MSTCTEWSSWWCSVGGGWWWGWHYVRSESNATTQLPTRLRRSSPTDLGIQRLTQNIFPWTSQRKRCVYV